MERKNKCKNEGFLTILWAVIMFLLCTTTAVQAITFGGGGTYDVTGNLSEPVFINGPGTVVNFSGTITTTDPIYVCLPPSTEATLNFKDNASAYWIQAFSGSIINLYSGNVNYAVTVYLSTSVTVYGDYFIIGTDTYYPPQTLPVTQVITSYDAEGGVLFSGPISCVPGATITLAKPTGPTPENEPPVADAGPDLIVYMMDTPFTVIDGLATDLDEGDTLQYRWLEESVEFTLFAPVGANGEAPLDLGTISPQNLDIGTHILTLEVTDGTDTVSDDMILEIIHQIDIKPGSYPNSINLGSNGVVPVAILSSETFDAATIDPSKVFLEGTSVAVRGKGNKYMAHTEDVNNDGLMDIVVQIETENLVEGEFQDGWATVTIEDDASNIIFQDSDEIIIVPPEG